MEINTVKEFEKIVKALDSLKEKTGMINISTEVEFVIAVNKYLESGVEEWLEEDNPMIYKLLFVNEAGEKDFIQIWDNRITNVCYPDENEYSDSKTRLAFSFIIDEDEDQKINFFVED
ncbi:hypothetical protein ACFQZE_06930 [Paenibacillus sp. GCM10027627]|uniref:hypothetical protein n=1 Tax=unclassified Paenibacillus TaxID=185978 RepID=UPI003640A131